MPAVSHCFCGGALGPAGIGMSGWSSWGCSSPGCGVLAGPGVEPVRGARRINGVLAAVRGLVTHAVTTGQAPGRLMPLIYELADERDLPVQGRGDDDGRMVWRRLGRHRPHEPGPPVGRA